MTAIITEEQTILCRAVGGGSSASLIRDHRPFLRCRFLPLCQCRFFANAVFRCQFCCRAMCRFVLLLLTFCRCRFATISISISPLPFGRYLLLLCCCIPQSHNHRAPEATPERLIRLETLRNIFATRVILQRDTSQWVATVAPLKNSRGLGDIIDLTFEVGY